MSVGAIPLIVGGIIFYHQGFTDITQQGSDLSKLVILLFGLVAIVVAAIVFSNSFVTYLKSIATTLDKSCGDIETYSLKSTEQLVELNHISVMQTDCVKEARASVEMLSAMANKNSEAIVNTQTAVEMNQFLADQGLKSFDKLSLSVNEIKNTNAEILQQMESANKEFAEMAKIISEIEQKTNVINEIVFQTKLLSFNASVEAARAGENGKGFAVVAEEVGNLARMSGNAAKEITAMLTDSIKKVNSIVHRSKARVAEFSVTETGELSSGQMTIEGCREDLNKITTNARAVSATVFEILQESKRQVNGISEMNAVISQLDKVTNKNMLTAQHVTLQANQLKTEMHPLSGVIKKFSAHLEGQDINFLQPKDAHVAEATPAVAMGQVIAFASDKSNKIEKIEKKIKDRKNSQTKDRATKDGETKDSRDKLNDRVKTKITSGTDVTMPSPNDPNFEDF